MEGYPKHLNTRADYELVIATFPREKWVPQLQAMLAERLQWFNLGKLETEDAGLEDATHKIVTMDMMGESERYQYELREDPNCDLLRLGLTVEQVETWLAEG